MKVLIFGGTHGNEWAGIMAITHYGDSLKKKYSTLDLEFILSNPEAYKINKRFKDEDLNRAFQFLDEDRHGSYENTRAREIKTMIDSVPCFVIDLHTTTASMGPTVILGHENRPNLSLAAALREKIPECKVILSPDPARKYLASQSDFGLIIEVGPVANGIVEARALESTINLLDASLAILADSTHDTARGEVEVFLEVEDVHYPTNEKGEISAYIHPEFQGRDFLPITGDYLPFRDFNGINVARKTTKELHPIFINEAAYYPQKMAFTLCQRVNKAY